MDFGLTQSSNLVPIKLSTGAALTAFDFYRCHPDVDTQGPHLLHTSDIESQVLKHRWLQPRDDQRYYDGVS